MCHSNDRFPRLKKKNHRFMLVVMNSLWKIMKRLWFKCHSSLSRDIFLPFLFVLLCLWIFRNIICFVEKSSVKKMNNLISNNLYNFRNMFVWFCVILFVIWMHLSLFLTMAVRKREISETVVVWSSLECFFYILVIK